MLFRDTLAIVMPMTNDKVPLILLLMTLVVSAVSFLPIQDVKAAPIELAYDNGNPNIGVLALFSGVKFSLPSGIHSAQILSIRYKTTFTPQPITIHITGADHVTELTAPIPTTPTAPMDEFNVLDVSSLNLIVSEDFYVVIEQAAGIPNTPVLDDQPNVNRSFSGTSLAGLNNLFDNNLVLRVIIDPNPLPVGGVSMSVNKLEIFAPYIAIAGLIVAISTVYVFIKRKD
jgi:hypothetical protein